MIAGYIEDRNTADHRTEVIGALRHTGCDW
jgi:hypothetical protein